MVLMYIFSNTLSIFTVMDKRQIIENETYLIKNNLNYIIYKNALGPREKNEQTITMYKKEMY